MTPEHPTQPEDNKITGTEIAAMFPGGVRFPSKAYDLIFDPPEGMGPDSVRAELKKLMRDPTQPEDVRKLVEEARPWIEGLKQIGEGKMGDCFERLANALSASVAPGVTREESNE
jgi:hypothetical protein